MKSFCLSLLVLSGFFFVFVQSQEYVFHTRSNLRSPESVTLNYGSRETENGHQERNKPVRYYIHNGFQGGSRQQSEPQAQSQYPNGNSRTMVKVIYFSSPQQESTPSEINKEAVQHLPRSQTVLISENEQPSKFGRISGDALESSSRKLQDYLIVPAQQTSRPQNIVIKVSRGPTNNAEDIAQQILRHSQFQGQPNVPRIITTSQTDPDRKTYTLTYVPQDVRFGDDQQYVVPSNDNGEKRQLLRIRTQSVQRGAAGADFENQSMRLSSLLHPAQVSFSNVAQTEYYDTSQLSGLLQSIAKEEDTNPGSPPYGFKDTRLSTLLPDSTQGLIPGAGKPCDICCKTGEVEPCISCCDPVPLLSLSTLKTVLG